jgi:hypothetical protein
MINLTNLIINYKKNYGPHMKTKLIDIYDLSVLGDDRSHHTAVMSAT